MGGELLLLLRADHVIERWIVVYPSAPWLAASIGLKSHLDARRCAGHEACKTLAQKETPSWSDLARIESGHHVFDGGLEH